MKAWLIANPAAGRKAGLTTNPASLADAARALQDQGVEFETHLTEHEGHATDLARAACFSEVDLVVVAGGDGTVQEAAQALVGTPVRLGIMPLGSVMNLAHSLGIPRDLSAAAQIIATRPARALDVGEARSARGTRYFLEHATCGIDVGTSYHFGRIDRGDPRALWRLLNFAARFQPRRLWIASDAGHWVGRSFLAQVNNTPFYGVHVPLAPEARMDDGLLDILVFRAANRLDLLLALLLPMLLGPPRPPRVSLLRARHVAINCERPMPCRADTTGLGFTPLHCRVVPAALLVHMPRAPGATAG